MQVIINNNAFTVKIAASSSERSAGMMGKRFDESFDGLLFLMGSGHHCFWMKNCIIPLDIVFIKDGIINKIHHNCPPSRDKSPSNYCGNGDLVLEVMGGTCTELGIKEGNNLVVRI